MTHRDPLQTMLNPKQGPIVTPKKDAEKFWNNREL